MSLLPGRPPLRGQRPAPGGGRLIQTRDVMLTIAAILAGFFGAVIVVSLLFGTGPTTSASDARVRTVISLAVGCFVLLGAFYGVMIRAKGYDWADFGVRPLPFHWRRVSLLVALLLVPIALVSAVVLQRFLGADQQELSRVITENGITLWMALVLFLYIALLQPIVEELIFRGMLFGWLRQSQSFALANALSAAAFAILHRQMVAIVVTFFIGLVLGWLRERSGSLLAPIVTHQVYNGLMLALSFWASVSTSQPA